MWLIRVHELKWDKKEILWEMGSPSLTPHSLEDPSIKSRQLGVAGNRVMRIIGNQASDS